MSRPLSAAAVTAAGAQRTDQAFLTLLAIEHEALPEPLRFTSDAVETVHAGEVYVPCPFSLTLPEERDDRPPTVRMVIDNVARAVIATLRSIPTAPTLTLTIVLGSTPDVVEAGPFVFTLRSATYDANAIVGELGYEEILDLPYPSDTFTPNLFPGLF